MSANDIHTQEKLNELGKRLKKLRKEKGYTNYEKFAFENNLSRSQIGRYENGADIRFSTLVKILDVLDISFEEFFKGFK